MSSLILASKSKARLALLAGSGLTFDCVAAEIDERAVEEPLIAADFTASDIASVLAQAKAQDVSTRFHSKLVIGADQTLSFKKQGIEHRFNKPSDMNAAREQLLALRNTTHTLHSSICCVRDGEVLFNFSDDAHLTMRDYSPEFVGRYLALVGKDALLSVGCYQLEGQGIQLFSEIRGDYFTILGLPLLPLLAFLRSVNEIDT